MAKKKTSKKATTRKATKKASAKKTTRKAAGSNKAASKPRKLGPELRAQELQLLARREFGTLGQREVDLVYGAALGRSLKLLVLNQNSRLVRPELLRWLCVFPPARELVDTAGLQLECAVITGSVDLNAANVPFPVRLKHCKIQGVVECKNADLRLLDLEWSSFDGLVGDGLRVRGEVWLRNSPSIQGEVRLVGARIGGNLDLSGTQTKNILGNALDLTGARIGGYLVLKGSMHSDGTFDLTECKVDVLADDLDCWPTQIKLGGFQYNSILHNYLGDVESRLAWLSKHDAPIDVSLFDPQPYRQLAGVFLSEGHESESDKILYKAAKLKATAKFKSAMNARKLSGGRLRKGVSSIVPMSLLVWNFLLDKGIGYGHHPSRLIKFLLLFIFGGSLFFGGFSWRSFYWPPDTSPNWMQPTQSKAVEAMSRKDDWIDEYPVFRPIAFSADAFLPLVDLHQETYWTPSNWFVKSVYLPFHIISGWVVTTLAAVSFTGLVRQEGK